MTEPLTITTSPRDDHQLDLTIQVGPERTELALHRGATKLLKRVNIPGFRRGRAPYAAVLRTHGRDALLSEILDELVQELLVEAMAEQNLQVFGEPAVEDVDLDPLTFKVILPLPPTVELGDYRSIRIADPEVTVTDDDVEAVIEKRREGSASWQEAGRPAELGDQLVMDIQGRVGEESIMDNHDWELVLKEESGWLPGFAAAFVGAAPGEERSFTLLYPEDSSSRYKGQEAAFQATVKQVKARIRPELDDDFAKSMGDYQDMADLRGKMKDELTRQRMEQAEFKLDEAAVNALIEGASLAYPPLVVEDALDSIMTERSQRLAGVGYKLADYLKLQGTNEREYRESLRPQAELRAKSRLVLGRLAVAEGIVPSPEEIEATIEKMAADAPDEAQAKTTREVFGSERGRQVVAGDLRMQKTLARLREIVRGQAAGPVGEPAEVPSGGGESGEAAESAPSEQVTVAEAGERPDETATADVAAEGTQPAV